MESNNTNVFYQNNFDDMTVCIKGKFRKISEIKCPICGSKVTPMCITFNDICESKSNFRSVNENIKRIDNLYDRTDYINTQYDIVCTKGCCSIKFNSIDEVQKYNVHEIPY